MLGRVKQIVWIASACGPCLLGSMAAPMEACASPCDNLDNNPAWTSGMTKMNNAYIAGDWNEALKIGKELQNICNDSPFLNYTLANIYKNQNNKERHLFFLERATEQTRNFVVDNDMLNRMWNDKYIAAHPEADPETIKKQMNELDVANRTLIDRDYEIQALKKELADSKKNLEDNIEMYKSLLWTGVGIGIGGLALTATGSALVITSDAIDFKENFNGPHKYTEKTEHVLGWALIGTGAALAITGSVLAGVYGYKYSHHKDNQTDVELSFSVLPNYTSIKVEF